MDTFEINPDGNLGELVEKIYVNYSEHFEYTGIAEPFLHPEIFFSFGENFQIGAYRFKPDPLNSSAIIGNRLTCVPVKVSGAHFSAGVIFKPWGLFSAFGMDGRLTTNQLIQTRNLPRLKEFLNLNEVVKELTPEIFLELLEADLRKRVRYRSPNSNFIKAYLAVNKLSMGQAEMKQIASEAGFSPKTLIELFNQHLGISPLKYIHVKTILESLKHLKQNPKISLTELALDLGFYDQSHFIRIFKSYMNMTPTEYQSLYAKVNFVQS